jgi:hypothetical protein
MVPSTPFFSKGADLQAELQIKYAGYVDRQINLIERFQKMEHVRLPDEFDYSRIIGLSREVREKLTRVRPRSLGQASRVPGITPAAMSLFRFIRKDKADNRLSSVTRSRIDRFANIVSVSFDSIGPSQGFIHDSPPMGNFDWNPGYCVSRETKFSLPLKAT